MSVHFTLLVCIRYHVVSGKEEMRKRLETGVAVITSGYGIDCSNQMKAFSSYCEKIT